jgi:hypothetical protein
LRERLKERLRGDAELNIFSRAQKRTSVELRERVEKEVKKRQRRTGFDFTWFLSSQVGI